MRYNAPIRTVEQKLKERDEVKSGNSDSQQTTNRAKNAKVRSHHLTKSGARRAANSKQQMYAKSRSQDSLRRHCQFESKIGAD
jgi:hypothetical protein